MEYLQPMSRIEPIAREYWFELLMAVLLLAGIVPVSYTHLTLPTICSV